MHYACQKQCHVCLGSHLTKPCLSCVVTSKTAAIHVRCQHSMCNFLSCKILQGPHPIALTRNAFLLAYWSIKESYTPFTMHHMHLKNSKQMYHSFTCHAPFNNLVLFPDYFSGTRLQCTFHLHIYAMHTLQGDTYMLDLSFSTYYVLQSCK